MGLDRFCYCCGGVTNYHIYGNICNRYCLKLFNKETLSFTKPCRLTEAKQKELHGQNNQKVDPDDENSSHDRPFPRSPQKMPLDSIQCTFDGRRHNYEEFAKLSSSALNRRDLGTFMLQFQYN